MSTKNGRMYESVLTALARAIEPLPSIRELNAEEAGTEAAGAEATSANRIALCSPAVGLWREAPEAGTLIRPGASLGRLEVLGRMHRLVAPERAYGVVVAASENQPLARQPVDHGMQLLLLDPDAVTAGESLTAESNVDNTATGLVFRASTSGRFYGRPSPDRDAFVSPGDVIEFGQAICLLEVMKTFNRVTYGGSGLPERARVVEVVPGDEQDLAAGDVILVLETA